MAKREAFLQAISKKNVDSFLYFTKRNKDSSDQFDLDELLQELPRKQKEELWNKLLQLLVDILTEHPMERWNCDLEQDSGDEMEVEVSDDLKHTFNVIDGIILITEASIPVIEKDIDYGALTECAVILNGIVNALPQSQIIIRNSIQKLCEAWWKSGLDGKDELGKTAFIMVLEKSLLLNNLVGDIQRLWKLHPVLLSFDYNSHENDELKNMLLQCFLSVNHIKREEGRRFLSFVFSWNANFIKLIHEAIKSKLQYFPKSVVENVAELYFRAWKKASGDFLKEIENVCIQDLMHHGVHLYRSSPVHSKVRQVLRFFHNQKHRQGVEEMLYRLYQPILWRGLKARNSDVRANAALLFTEVFPVRDPSFNNETMDNEIQKQFETLFKLLEDPQPIVRSSGVLGVCTIVAKYWEMIPPAIITDLIKKLLVDLSADMSSAEVRCSVFKCMTVILDNKLSHPLLEQLLPVLKNSLHDHSEKVRVAFVDLLQKIKAVKAAKFWKVCSMEHLLVRLEIDSPPVSKRIVNLLFNSFFPVNESEIVWCERCVTLIQMNPMAARKFYQYAYVYTAPTNIAKLMLTIRRCLNTLIQKSMNEEQDEALESNKENSSVLEDVLSVHDTASVAGLLEVIVILWRTIHKSLQINKDAFNFTVAKFASVMPEYLKLFQDDRCIAPLIILASFMPPATIPTFSCGVLSKLRNLEKGAPESKYSPLIDCLCQWGQVGHLTELITDWLTEVVSQKKSKRDSQRRVRIQEVMESKPDLAIDYLEYILTHTINRECLVAMPQNKLNQLLKSLLSLKEMLFSSISSSEAETSESDTQTALRGFVVHCRLSVHLHHKFNTSEKNYLSFLENTSEELVEKVLPFLRGPGSEDQSIKNQTAIAKEVIEAFLSVLKDVIMIGFADIDLQGQSLQLCLDVLQTGGGYVCIPVIIPVLKEITLSALAQSRHSESEELSLLLVVIQNVFQKILESIASRLRKDREEALLMLNSIQMGLGELICVTQDWHYPNTSVLRGVLSSILAAMLVEMARTLQKISCPEELNPPNSVEDLPPLSCLLLKIILKLPKLIRSLLMELIESVESEAVEGLHSLAVVLFILKVLVLNKCKDTSIKISTACVQRRLQSHCELLNEDDLSFERKVYQLSVQLVNEILQL
ncbi:condensin-2 complex subunit G2 [Polypterus senegalus]|uniref:condensin-2 complex subunit G2 n=1 Tax=Polypterus senegalus TaxID=55291 RepID=UPI00196659C7|nr:condensin-2 complex subunit G2 [Polypterus senegalus]